MKPTWNPPKIIRSKKSKLTVLGIRTGVGATKIWFLDARRRADAEGERNEALLGGNRVQNRGDGKNVLGLRQDGDGFGGSGVRSGADSTLGRVSCARMVMRGKSHHWPYSQQQAKQRDLFRDWTHGSYPILP
jgi:hypothetical protein